MLKYVGTRFVIFVVSIFVASVVVFGFMAVLPGDPAVVALGVNASPDAVAALRAEFGTDRPLAVQYLDWVGGLLTGDFGTSYVTRNPIGPIISDRLAVTSWLVLCAMAVALVTALPLGTLSALRHRKASGLAISFGSQIGIAIPAFVMGIALVYVFAVWLRVLPSGGWVVPIQDPGGFIQHLVLPVLSLGLVQGAILTRYVRSATLDVMREDYIRTARSKGLSGLPIVTRHILRNSSIPVVTVLGLQLTTLLIGAVVIERVFVVPGLGSLLLDSVANRDLLTVQGVVMVLVLAALIINFVVDILYTVLDPRLRSS
ncbi:MAG: ABC transporter permease [Intrasporangium sp.]|uniref:ABC transporter permease n=1 Tax=Intrasporangium sp. TaxID=1925024 RepID=UPI0026492B78|nr:ABC transporter permease [Intrasporangium sp.]MDN5794881.1 ABC transporter permease [Intrasporangium sp.]